MAYINGNEILFSPRINTGAGVEIVQKTGASDTAVMSQKATTDIFATKKDLLKGKTKSVNTDIAYSKDIHANTAPYAEIVKIGGMTYKDGNTLKSAPVTEVESVGANKFDVEKATLNNNNGTSATLQRSGNDIIFNYGNATNDFFAFSYWLETEPNTDYYISVNSLSVNSCYVYTDKLFGTSIAYIGAKGGKFNSGNNNKLLLGFYSVASQRLGTSEVISEIGIYKDTLKPYAPFTKNTLAIPEEVRPKNGINENVYDYIEWCADGTKKKYECVEKIILDGSEVWNRVATSGITPYYYTRLGSLNSVVNQVGLCDRYEMTVISSSTTEEGFYIFNSSAYSSANLYVRDLSFQTLDEWKAHLAENPLTVYYAPTTPIITDISDILSADNFIGVDGGGTLTFKNEFGYDVPSEVHIYTDTNSGTGAGDMSMSVYDSNGNGIVDQAEKDGKGNNIFDTYANKKSVSNIEITLTSLLASLSTQIASLTARVAALESGNGSAIEVGTDVTGRTIRVTCVADCEQSGGENYDVLNFGNGNKIEACVNDGYYQGYGAFEGIYDRSDFEAITYNGGGTVTVYNKNYILLEDV